MNAMQEVIAQMRREAHEIAVRRRQEWWARLAPEQRKLVTAAERDGLDDFKPGVIELDINHPTTPYMLQVQLMMHDVFVSLEELAAHTQEERELASLWGSTVMLSASDNDVIVAPRPEWLPARDASGWDHGEQIADLVTKDIESHGGEEAAKREFHEPYKVADDQIARDAEEMRRYSEPDWVNMLRDAADALQFPEFNGITAAERLELGQRIHDWLNSGAPMLPPHEGIEPAKYEIVEGAAYNLDGLRIDAYDSSDTSVAEDISTENKDGNASRTTEWERGRDHDQLLTDDRPPNKRSGDTD